MLLSFDDSQMSSKIDTKPSWYTLEHNHTMFYQNFQCRHHSRTNSKDLPIHWAPPKKAGISPSVTLFQRQQQEQAHEGAQRAYEQAQWVRNPNLTKVKRPTRGENKNLRMELKNWRMVFFLFKGVCSTNPSTCSHTFFLFLIQYHQRHMSYGEPIN